MAFHLYLSPAIWLGFFMRADNVDSYILLNVFTEIE